MVPQHHLLHSARLISKDYKIPRKLKCISVHRARPGLKDRRLCLQFSRQETCQLSPLGHESEEPQLAENDKQEFCHTTCNFLKVHKCVKEEHRKAAEKVGSSGPAPVSKSVPILQPGRGIQQLKSASWTQPSRDQKVPFCSSDIREISIEYLLCFRHYCLPLLVQRIWQEMTLTKIPAVVELVTCWEEFPQ